MTAEFSIWRSEQHSWRTGCALLDQSHHMTDLFLRAPLTVRATVAPAPFVQYARENYRVAWRRGPGTRSIPKEKT